MIIWQGNKRFMHPRLRRQILITGVVGIVLLTAAGAGLILVDRALSGFVILPQDCNGTSMHLSGAVHNVSDATVSVKGEAGLYPGGNALDFSLTSDSNGNFDSGESKLRVFVCEILSITISAQGFETRHVNYVLIDHFSETALASSMTEGYPVAVVLDIELQPA